ncbi:hypothetical protein WJX72_003885 [[Myrmecia] bisecta]|uniref:Uncharacterized protein n=1 Tax=[Myrmecia] bisecta TaxID=41462 RepID=A0AAW1PBD9_9CHLO
MGTATAHCFSPRPKTTVSVDLYDQLKSKGYTEANLFEFAKDLSTARESLLQKLEVEDAASDADIERQITEYLQLLLNSVGGAVDTGQSTAVVASLSAPPLAGCELEADCSDSCSDQRRTGL